MSTGYPTFDCKRQEHRVLRYETTTTTAKRFGRQWLRRGHNARLVGRREGGGGCALPGGQGSVRMAAGASCQGVRRRRGWRCGRFAGRVGRRRGWCSERTESRGCSERGPAEIAMRGEKREGSKRMREEGSDGGSDGGGAAVVRRPREAQCNLTRRGGRANPVGWRCVRRPSAYVIRPRVAEEPLLSQSDSSSARDVARSGIHCRRDSLRLERAQQREKRRGSWRRWRLRQGGGWSGGQGGG